MLHLSANLPDGQVGVAPDLADVVDDFADLQPVVVGEGSAHLLREIDSIEKLAVDIELDVIGGAIADSDGLLALVAVEVVESDLGDLLRAVDGVPARVRASAAAVRPRPENAHDLQAAILVLRLHQPTEPVDILVRLLGEAESQKGVDGERGVANPGITAREESQR